MVQNSLLASDYYWQVYSHSTILYSDYKAKLTNRVSLFCDLLYNNKTDEDSFIFSAFSHFYITRTFHIATHTTIKKAITFIYIE